MNIKEVFITAGAASGSIAGGFVLTRWFLGDIKGDKLTQLYHEAFPNLEGEPTKAQLRDFEEQLEQYGWARGEYNLDTHNSEGEAIEKPTGFAYNPPENTLEQLENLNQSIDIIDPIFLVSAVAFAISMVGVYATRKG